MAHRLEDPRSAVEDPGDPIDVEASPAAWLSTRALVVAAVVVGLVLIAAVAGSLLYWYTPPTHAIDVPVVPRA